ILLFALLGGKVKDPPFNGRQVEGNDSGYNDDRRTRYYAVLAGDTKHCSPLDS
ncbi:hypothetical protein J6590_106672, partial [Homalodisca vitripennis]